MVIVVVVMVLNVLLSIGVAWNVRLPVHFFFFFFLNFQIMLVLRWWRQLVSYYISRSLSLPVPHAIAKSLLWVQPYVFAKAITDGFWIQFLNTHKLISLHWLLFQFCIVLNDEAKKHFVEGDNVRETVYWADI